MKLFSKKLSRKKKSDDIIKKPKFGEFDEWFEFTLAKMIDKRRETRFIKYGTEVHIAKNIINAVLARKRKKEFNLDTYFKHIKFHFEKHLAPLSDDLVIPIFDRDRRRFNAGQLTGLYKFIVFDLITMKTDLAKYVTCRNEYEDFRLFTDICSVTQFDIKWLKTDLQMDENILTLLTGSKEQEAIVYKMGNRTRYISDLIGHVRDFVFLISAIHLVYVMKYYAISLLERTCEDCILAFVNIGISIENHVLGKKDEYYELTSMPGEHGYQS